MGFKSHLKRPFGFDFGPAKVRLFFPYNLLKPISALAPNLNCGLFLLPLIDFRMNKLPYIALFWVMGLGNSIFANNIAISNVYLTNHSVNFQSGVYQSGVSDVNFDLSWQNSWYTNTGPSNWDAAWVFVKFQVGSVNPTFSNVTLTNGQTTVTLPSVINLRVGMPMIKISGTTTVGSNIVITAINNVTNVITLSSAPSGTTASNNTIEFLRIWEHATITSTVGPPAGFTYDPITDSSGVFLHRNVQGSGNNNLTGLAVVWEYALDGVEDTAEVRVQVFAIEMVYVPQGQFTVGDGNSSDAFTQTTITTATANAVGGRPTGETAPAATWPNGFNAFYCMKYEISQGQYRDFLNTLTYNQQVTRTVSLPTANVGTGALSSSNSDRSGIDIQTQGIAASQTPAVYACNLDNDGNYNENVDGEWLACNLLTWMDGCAYADWAGLRPMTELEFEKVCRGNQSAVQDEYAWGTTSITASTNVTNGGRSNETSSTAGANCVYDNKPPNGPLRVGVFATATSTRTQSGASYYGILDLSGNLTERPVNISHANGRAFTGVNGDGILSRAGNANAINWPTLAVGEVTGANGSADRGGHWRSATLNNLEVSFRNTTLFNEAGRSIDDGFRGVRFP